MRKITIQEISNEKKYLLYETIKYMYIYKSLWIVKSFKSIYRYLSHITICNKSWSFVAEWENLLCQSHVRLEGSTVWNFPKPWMQSRFHSYVSIKAFSFVCICHSLFEVIVFCHGGRQPFRYWDH